LAIRPAEQDSGAYSATVFAAVGKDYREASNALSDATARGFRDLLRETEEHWKAWLGKASIPGALDPEVVALSKRCLLTMATATDLYSRAIVRAPVSQPPLCLDWPRHGVWTTQAYDLAGFHGLAEEHALFYLDAFRGLQDSARHEPERGKPYGSLPAALYANGVEALPRVVLEPDASAWTLLSYWQHSGFLAPPQRAAFLGIVWDGVNASADFLAGWADGNTGAPQYSFDWSLLRDTRGPELTLATFAGLKSALRIAETLGHERQDWQRRLRELEPILLQGCLDSSGSWRVAEPLPYWIADLEPLQRPLLEVASSRMEALRGREGVDAARTLYHLSMIWRQQADQTGELALQLKPTLKRSLGMPDDASVLAAAFPDAVAASYAFLAARNLLTFRGWGKPPGGVE
jgi:hypothetical protein